MRLERTAIAIVREHVEDWRRANDWSRETLAQTVVEAHEAAGFDRVTGIEFDPPARDTFKRLRVNADRIFRWLDDTTKDSNLLPFNFLLSILASMPMDRRMALVDELLEPVQIGAREELTADIDPAEDPERAVVQHVQAMITTGAEAQAQAAQLLDGVDPHEPAAAKAKINRAIATFQRARAFLGRLVPRHRRKGATP